MKNHFYAFLCAALSFLLLTVAPNLSYGQSAFVTVWKTDNPGTSATNQIIIPAGGDFTYTWEAVGNPTINGMGTGMGETTITFPQPGNYEVHMTASGTDPLYHFYMVQFGVNDKEKLLELKQWGTVQWSTFKFNGCDNLTITASDTPDLSNVTELDFAFSNSGVGSIPNINNWDVSNVTSMSSMFQSCGFNQSLSNWNVSEVTDMSFMFDGASNFNQSLTGWNVSKLEYIDYMFRDASNFNQAIIDWSLDSLIGGVGVYFRSGLSCENYSYTLYAFATNPNTATDVLFHPYGPGYSPAVATFRNYLIDSLGWNIVGDALGTCNVVLAVDFLSFTATQIQNQARLQWETASETNNSGFQIERSADGLNWQSIGFKSAQSSDGNSTQIKEYNFYDAQPVSGVNFYRLKQIDFDGSYTYSRIRQIDFKYGSVISLYPNPTTDYVVVSGLRGNETIKLYDLIGRKLKQLSTNSNSIQIDLSQYTTAVYVLIITSEDGKSVSHKLIKQ